jgi:hypothetical protein
MSEKIRGILSLVILYWIAGTLPAQAQSSDAKAILQEAAKAMGGTQALRSLKNQVVESEGKQFDHTSTKRPGNPSQQVASFRSTLTRDLTQMRLRLEWDGRTAYPRDATVRWVEVIDGSVGLLQEGGQQPSQAGCTRHGWPPACVRKNGPLRESSWLLGAKKL